MNTTSTTSPTSTTSASTTARLTTSHPLLVLDGDGFPMFELEHQGNGVRIIATDGRRLGWVPIEGRE